MEMQQKAGELTSRGSRGKVARRMVSRNPVAKEVRVASVAILSPQEFDNYQFWDLVYDDARDEVASIKRAARAAGLTEQSLKSDVFFPKLESLVQQLVKHSSNAKKIFDIVKRCAVDSNADYACMDSYLSQKRAPELSSSNSFNDLNNDDGSDDFLGAHEERLNLLSPRRSSRLSPSFILSCVLAGGILIAVAMLSGATAGVVAASAVVATAAFTCDRFFYRESSSREQLEPQTPSCCLG